MSEPFRFYTEANLVKLLGIKASDPIELLDGLKKVPPASIFYHTHRFLQQHHYLSPEPPNDFAFWLANTLNLAELGEKIASVNIIRFRKIEDLRKEFVTIVDDYLSKGKHISASPEGEELHFKTCVTFIIPTPYFAHNLREFAGLLDKISIEALYFHIFEAPKRLGTDENDFAAWFEGIGQSQLANRLRKLDPYTITLEGLRKKIKLTVMEYAKD